MLGLFYCEMKTQASFTHLQFNLILFDFRETQKGDILKNVSAALSHNDHEYKQTWQITYHESGL